MDKPEAYRADTGGIVVSVEPFYLEDQSEPEKSYFVWAYKVRIENRRRETVQLRTRHWRITDARGRVQEVRGVGVVGEEPVLAPGERFEYTSGCPLPTPSGFMAGAYRMEGPDGFFDVAIPAFSLDSPHETRSLQ